MKPKKPTRPPSSGKSKNTKLRVKQQGFRPLGIRGLGLELQVCSHQPEHLKMWLLAGPVSGAASKNKPPTEPGACTGTIFPKFRLAAHVYKS